jgi:hypothetical protein
MAENGWRQTLTWKVAYRRAQADRPYSCPRWADEQVYCLAWLEGRGLDIPKTILPEVNREWGLAQLENLGRPNQAERSNPSAGETQMF